MKKLLLILLATALTGSFTSCVENEIPDEVVAIYNNQANYLAAQAALLQSEANVNAAEAARKNAEAAYEQARAAALAAEQARLDMQAAADAAKTQAEADEILAQIARNDAAAAQALAAAQIAADQAAFNLQRSQQQWAEQMAATQRAIDQAAAAAATAAEQAAANAIQTAFTNYINANYSLDLLKLDIANTEKDILDELAKIQDKSTTDAERLAGLEADLATENANLAGLIADLADAEAMNAVGTTDGDRKAQVDAWQATIDANMATMEELSFDLNFANEAVNDALAARTATGFDQVWVDYNNARADYYNAVGSVNYWTGQVANHAANVEAAEDAVTDLQDIVDNYDTKKADFKAATTAAKAALKAAQDGLAAAQAALVAANVVVNGNGKLPADKDYIAGTIVDLANTVAAEAAALASLQAAVNAYKAAEAAVAPTTALETAVTVAEGAVVTAQAAYDDAKAAFDANPTGSRVLDGGADGQIGIFSDAVATTYMEIGSIGGTGAIFIGTKTAAVPAGETASAAPNYAAITPADIGLFFNVEMDDAAPVDNSDGVNNTAAALDAAKANVVAAKAALKAQQDANDTSDEKAAYEAAEAFYSTAQAQVAAADAADKAAKAAVTAAGKAVTDAGIVLNGNGLGATDPLLVTGAVADEAAAVAAENAFNASTESQYQDALQAAIVELNLLNRADSGAGSLGYWQGEVQRLFDLIEAGPVYTAEMLAANDAVESAEDAFDALNIAYNTLFNENGRLNTYIGWVNLSGYNATEGMIAAIEGNITASENEVARITGLITNFNPTSTSPEESMIEFYEESIARMNAQLAKDQAIVDRLKAILDALL